MASDIQISSNRANSRLSTGPSLAARGHTRYNGLKTGIRFRGEFLPTERPEEFQERVAFWTRSLKPRNAGERELVFKYARAEWVHARAERALGARIYTQDAQAGDRADAGVEKNLRLLYWDRRGPLCMYALSNAVSDRLQTSWTPEIDDPIEPSVVLKSLEGCAKGCERLIGEWKALAGRLENGRAWQPHERLKSIRLMGKQPVDAVGDDRVLLVYAATFALGPIGRKGAFEDLRCDMGAMEYERFVERIRSQEELLPVSGADAPGACVALLDLVARNVERLEAKLERTANTRRRPRSLPPMIWDTTTARRASGCNAMSWPATGGWSDASTRSGNTGAWRGMRRTMAEKNAWDWRLALWRSSSRTKT